VSGLFDEGKVFGSRPSGGRQRPPRALFPTLGVLVVLLILGSTFTDVWTERLWFVSVDHSEVFRTLISTRVLLFVVFGLLLSAIVVANVVIAYRTRPLHRMLAPEQRSLDRYRNVVEPLRRIILVVLAAALFFFGGTSAASHWESYLLWRNGGEFGQDDEFFGIDIGFFVFDYPFIRYLIGFGFAIIVVSLIAVALTNYLYGGISLQGKDKVSGSAQVHLSVLIGFFMLLRAAAYWMDRYGLALEDGNLFTGVHYTDANAVLPAKNILTVISVICALLFFANVVRRTWMLPGLAVGMLVLSAVLLGGLWPFIVQQFQVRPSEPDREGEYIERNIAATREAYDIDQTQVDLYNAVTTLSPAQLREDAQALPGTRLLDPTLVSPAFEQLQQVRGFYRVPQTLDVDRYVIDGEKRDMVVGLRELNLGGLPEDQRNWNNDHTVYTHGYGLVAAYGNRRTPEGEPEWADQGRPPSGELGEYEPRVYFGELGPSYSVVGAPEDSTPVELELPAGGGEGDDEVRTTTYGGTGGVPVGGLFNQLLYAVKFREANIVLSDRVNDESKIIYDRQPRQRVEKVAPWLIVDGNPYPAVVDERIVWIVDGYTTSNAYPGSTRVSLSDTTSDSLTPTRAFAAQPDDDLNYVRNSVKAVVDAYHGTVTLYEWDEEDPVLAAWRNVFPDAVKDRGEIPPDLLAHLRYPEDLFKLQRATLTQYHVTDAGDFYQGNDRWKVPEDPAVDGRFQPPYYLSLRMPDRQQAAFSLTSVFTPQNREILAGMMAVDADATSDQYGTIRLLQLPNDTQVQGPGQVANAFNSDSDIAEVLLPFRQAQGASASFGNLLTLPVGDGLLYVQPVYTQRQAGAGNYPVLSYVLASFGDKVGFGSNLSEALDVVLGADSGISDENEPGTPEPPPATAEPTTEPTPGPTAEPTPGPTGGASANQLLQQAQQKFVEADAALRRGDLQEWSRLYEEGRALFEQALEARGVPNAAPTG
jgi:uncharacterized membrane protein (UPF0182 family)